MPMCASVPMTTPPAMRAPGEMCVCAPTTTSCSPIAPRVHNDVFTDARTGFTMAPAKTTVASPRIALVAMIAERCRTRGSASPSRRTRSKSSRRRGQAGTGPAAWAASREPARAIGTRTRRGGTGGTSNRKVGTGLWGVAGPTPSFMRSRIRPCWRAGRWRDGDGAHEALPKQPYDPEYTGLEDFELAVSSWRSVCFRR